MASNRASRRAISALVVALSTLGGALACGGPTEIKATSNTIAATLTIHAVNGTSPVKPAAIVLVGSPAAVRMTTDYNFDLAVDFDQSGAARLVPVDRVASQAVIGTNRLVGFQKLAEAFENVTRAPNSGYVTRADFPVAVGDVGVIESLNNPYCSNFFFSLSPHIYAKFAVEAIDPVERSIRLRLVVDPNCGFRGLETGLPSR